MIIDDFFYLQKGPKNGLKTKHQKKIKKHDEDECQGLCDQGECRFKNNGNMNYSFKVSIFVIEIYVICYNIIDFLDIFLKSFL